MYRVALTGGIGCGKTTVSDLFGKLGVPVIDTDQVSRKLMQPGSPLLDEITAQFGAGLVDNNGQLDRAALKQLVFADDSARQRLESLTHPRIMQEVEHQLAGLNADYALVVIPLLVETGLRAAADRVLVVDCPVELQHARVMARDEDADGLLVERMIASQASRASRLAMADDVISNDAQPDALVEQVAALHAAYCQRARAQNKTVRA